MADLPGRTERTDAFWRAFRDGTGHEGGQGREGREGDYEVVAFGDSPRMADELAALVVDGPKRATAGLLRDFGPDGEAMPTVGGHVVLVDGSGEPRAVWRTTEVRVGPLDSVDEGFAWDEGEGERTRADWLRMHRDFFRAQAKAEGFEFRDDVPTVFERFEVVWPTDD